MSLRSKRQSVAPGGAKRNPGTTSLDIPKPALAGDRIFRPLKRALSIFWITNPGARSLRSLHPGLNSAVRFADSLSLDFSLTQIQLSHLSFNNLLTRLP